MGYFANGEEGIAYEDYYCSRCVHYLRCAVWEAHMYMNYEECNNKKSILHILIPRDENGKNMRCRMFFPVDQDQEVQ